MVQFNGEYLKTLPPEVIQSTRRGPDAHDRFLEIQTAKLLGEPVRATSDMELQTVSQGLQTHDPSAVAVLDLLRKYYPNDLAVLETMANGLEENVSVLDGKIRQTLAELWSTWDPSKALAEQSGAFTQARAALYNAGFQMMHLRVLPSQDPSDRMFIQLSVLKGSDQGLAESLPGGNSLMVHRLSLGLEYYLLENVAQHVPTHEALVLFHQKGRQKEWVVMDRGNGIPDEPTTGKPNLRQAIQDRISLSPTGSQGSGLFYITHRATGGAEIWSNGHGLVISPVGIGTKREISPLTSVVPIQGTLVFIRLGNSAVGLEESVELKQIAIQDRLRAVLRDLTQFGFTYQIVDQDLVGDYPSLAVLSELHPGIRIDRSQNQAETNQLVDDLVSRGARWVNHYGESERSDRFRAQAQLRRPPIRVRISSAAEFELIKQLLANLAGLNNADLLETRLEQIGLSLQRIFSWLDQLT